MNPPRIPAFLPRRPHTDWRNRRNLRFCTTSHSHPPRSGAIVLSAGRAQIRHSRTTDPIPWPPPKLRKTHTHTWPGDYQTCALWCRCEFVGRLRSVACQAFFETREGDDMHFWQFLDHVIYYLYSGKYCAFIALPYILY